MAQIAPMNWFLLFSSILLIAFAWNSKFHFYE